MIRFNRLVCTTVAVILLASGVSVAQAQAQASGNTFGWFAEVVSFDAATGTLTAKAKAEKHVAARAGHFKTGDSVVLAWAQFNHEADAVRYVVSEKDMAAGSGYLVRGRFVSVDPGSETLTFSTVIPAKAGSALAAAKPGTPVRVGASLVPLTPAAAVVSVALNRTAPARPAPVVAVKPVDNSRQMAGAWEVATNMMGNELKLACTFTQEGAKLDGMCDGPGPFAKLPADGKIDGDQVSFGFSITSPISLKLLHIGTLDAAGTKIEGSLDLMGNITPFVATRQ
jgi:hypothetical protein